MFLRRLIVIVTMGAALAPMSSWAMNANVDSLRAELVALDEDTTRIMTLHHLARELFFASSDSVLPPALEAERLARRLHFDRGLMLALYDQGLGHYGAGRYDEALDHYQQALAIADEIHAPEVRFKLVNNIGVIHSLTGQHAEALRAYQECLDTCEDAAACHYRPTIMLNIGNIYAGVDDYARAAEIWLEAAELLGEDDHPRLVSLYDNLGVAYRHLDDLDLAIEYGTRALDMRRRIGPEVDLASPLSNLAATAVHAGDLEAAERYIDEALVLLETADRPAGRMSILLTLSAVRRYQGRLEESVTFAEEALRLTRDLDDAPSRKTAHDNLGSSLMGLGAYKEAARHMEVAMSLTDSLNDAGYIRRIAMMQATHDHESEKAALAMESQRSLDVLEHRHRFRMLITVIIGLTMLLLAGILAQLYRVQKRFNSTLASRNDILGVMVAERTRELRAVSRQLVRLREDERRRLARDIHDDLGQAMTAVRMHIAHASTRQTVEEIKPVLAVVEGIVGDAARESSRLIQDLRPTALEKLGLEGALQWLADNHRQRFGVKVRVELPRDFECAEDTRLALFRIAQEALHNSGKHADATDVLVKLRREGGGAVLMVKDDGAGFVPEDREPQCFGVQGMMESARALDGTFECISAPGEGAEIHVVIPCRRYQ
jgi:signal transduction histidine kinase